MPERGNTPSSTSELPTGAVNVSGHGMTTREDGRILLAVKVKTSPGLVQLTMTWMSSSTSSRSERLMRHVLVVSFRCFLRVRLVSEQGRPETKRFGVKNVFSKRARISLSGASSSRPSFCRRERFSLRPRTATERRSSSAAMLVCDARDECAASSSRFVGNEAVFVARGGADGVISETVDGFEAEDSQKKHSAEASSAVAAATARRRWCVGHEHALAFEPSITHVNNRPSERRRIFRRTTERKLQQTFANYAAFVVGKSPAAWKSLEAVTRNIPNAATTQLVRRPRVRVHAPCTRLSPDRNTDKRSSLLRAFVRRVVHCGCLFRSSKAPRVGMNRPPQATSFAHQGHQRLPAVTLVTALKPSPASLLQSCASRCRADTTLAGMA